MLADKLGLKELTRTLGEYAKYCRYQQSWSKDTIIDPTENISNYQLPTIGINNAQHSMALYLAIIQEMANSGVPDDAVMGGNLWYDFDSIVTQYTVLDSHANLFTVGEGDDYLQGSRIRFGKF